VDIALRESMLKLHKQLNLYCPIPMTFDFLNLEKTLTCSHRSLNFSRVEGKNWLKDLPRKELSETSDLILTV
jgi:hypothetical protein